MKDFNNQTGRSMIEMLGVLAIIGVLSVGGIAGYSKAMRQYRLNKTIEQITLIAGNVRAFFAPQRNYEGLTTGSDTGIKIIKKAKLVPDEMWNNNKTALENAFGGEFEIMQLGDKSFMMAFTSIPTEACIEILGQDWSIVNVNWVAIGQQSYSAILKAPIDIATATNECTKAYTENKTVEGGYVIEFYFDAPDYFSDD